MFFRRKLEPVVVSDDSEMYVIYFSSPVYYILLFCGIVRSLRNRLLLRRNGCMYQLLPCLHMC